MIKKALSSLNGKLLGILLLAIMVASAVMLTVTRLGDRIVLTTYMEAEAVSNRESEIYGEFATFVHKNNIASRDSEAISRWSNEHKYATIFIYNGQSLNLRVEGGEAVRGEQEKLSEGYHGRLYTLRFADAICRVAVTDTSEARLYAMVNILSIAAAGGIFIIIMLSYFRVQTHRMIRLSKEAARISLGEMDAPITTEGKDEISMLAMSMDRMRNSVIERMSTENRALQANRDLITAISHDIRTPMTSMMGYLGMLSESDLSDREQAKLFINSAYAKAEELKQLTDELFKYFLVFGKNELEMNTEDFEAEILIEQLAAEAEFDLLDNGYQTKRIGEVPSGIVTVDPLYLKRVMDNIISNIKKYADPEHYIVFLVEENSGRLSVCVSNNIRKSPQGESTKIGLRTCEKIMENLGGKFLTTSDEEHFMAEFTLPIKPPAAEN